MPVITCPDCGLETDLPQINRTAEEFCVKCDYPLFWATAGAAMAPGAESSDANLRRLPGTGGRRTVGAKACPSCGENNPLTGTHCIRCGGPLEKVVEEIRGEHLPTPPPYEPTETADLKAAFYAVAALAVLAIVVLVLALLDVI